MTDAPANPKLSDELSNPDLDGLVKLSNREGVDIRPTLLRVITDLYLQKSDHSAQASQRYERLALKLIEHVDAKTKATHRPEDRGLSERARFSAAAAAQGIHQGQNAR